MFHSSLRRKNVIPVSVIRYFPSIAFHNLGHPTTNRHRNVIAWNYFHLMGFFLFCFMCWFDCCRMQRENENFGIACAFKCICTKCWCLFNGVLRCISTQENWNNSERVWVISFNDRSSYHPHIFCNTRRWFAYALQV